MSKVSSLVPTTQPPISDLVDLRGRHSTLLQRLESRETQLQPSPGEMLGFLEAARVFGGQLSGMEKRETAQGIMDFWASKLLGRYPQAAETLDAFYLDRFKEKAPGPGVTGAEGAGSPDLPLLVDRASALVKQADPKKRALLNRLLLRLFRLKKNSVEVYPVPLAAEDVILKEPGVRELLKELVAAGVVRQTAGDDTPDAARHELVDSRLLVQWNELNELSIKRRGFRELSRGWENGGRPVAALLNGRGSLRDAAELPALDDIESKFLNDSREQNEKQFKYSAGVLIGLVLLITSGVIWSNTRLSSERDALKVANGELAEANKLLEEERDKVAKANAQLKAEKERAEATARDLQVALNQTQRALTNADRIRLQAQLPTGKQWSPEEMRKLQEAIQHAGKELDDVKQQLNKDISPKYRRKF